MNAADYGVTIRRGAFEGEVCFEARVQELPDIVEYADTYEEAYQLAMDAIATTAEVFAEKGRRMPEPVQVNDDYSGRVTLRIPKTLHASLARRADLEGVSLNHLLVSALAAFRGFDAYREDDAMWWSVVGDTPKQKKSGATHSVVMLSDYRDQAAGAQ